MRPSHVLVGGGLDGRPGFAAIPDPNSSDGWAHARGMMQFLTTTWRAFATLGEGRPTDAAPDIDHAWDAIATAARFLCNDNDTIADLRAALRRYNNSSTYVDAVLTKATEYGLDSTDPTDDTTDATNPSPGYGDTITGDAGRIVAFARDQLGKPYKWGGEGPDAFDCSGPVTAAYRTIGIRLPHYATAQARYGRTIDPDTEPIQAGDLIFTRAGHPTHDLGHVGVAIDDQNYIVTPRSGAVIKITPIPDQRVQAVRRVVDETSASSSYASDTPPDLYADSDTASVNGLGLRWDTTLVDHLLTRVDAVALARAADRIAATSAALAAHPTRMKQANQKLRVLGWIDPSPGTDITQPAVEQAVVDTCLHTINASGYDGCLLNLPLIPPQACGANVAPIPEALPMPTTAGSSEPSTVAATTSPSAPQTIPCPTAAQWNTALHSLVNDLTNRSETDDQPLILINSDGTRPIVRVAA